MTFLDRLPIRRKLTLAVTLTSAASLICAFLAFVGYTVWQQRTSTLAQLNWLAETTAADSASAMLLGDTKSVQESLALLGKNRQIISAVVLDGAGQIIAQYAKRQSATEDSTARTRFWHNEVNIAQKIIHDGRTIGEIRLHADLCDMWRGLGLGALITSLLLLLAFLISLLLGRRLQRIVSEPILSLSQTALHISRDKDYTQRAKKNGDDEIGVLIDSFNEMLSQIQLRDRQLGEHNETLEKTVAERTADMAHLRDEAIASNKAKSEFLANMSHEIRTPMNTVVGMTTLLERTPLDDKQKYYLDNIHLAADNLLRIINDILDFSKIEAHKLQFENAVFDLDEVFSRLSRIFGVKAEEKGIELVINYPHGIHRALVGDPLRLGQVLDNLVSNAIKFTEHGEIVIGVRELRNAPENVRLYFFVRDTGIGLDESQTDNLFQPFSQADASTTRRFSGTGLGLAISKQLVEMMHGEIGVHSEKGRGSEFFFTAHFAKSSGVGALPTHEELTEDEEAEQILLQKEKTALHNHRALVVDDNRTAREILCAMLKDLGITPRAFSSGNEAIAELERVGETDEAYDLLLLDWKMPGMDGIETLRQIRARAGSRRLPRLIMVSSHAQDELRSHLQPDEADGFLHKPVTPQTLCHNLACALGIDPAQEISTTDESSGDARDNRLQGSVLLVEDHKMNQIVARDMLETLGIKVTVAESGQDAINRLQQQTFDLVLMDIQMPEMDGYETTRRIRQQLLLCNLPILAMTAHAMRGIHEQCLAAGMDGHISKPVQMDTFSAALTRWLPQPPPHTPPHPAPDADDTEVALPEYSPAINVRLALKHLGRRRRLYRQLLLDFAAENKGKSERIDAALAAGKRNEAEDILHPLKGIAANLGMLELSDAIFALEEALKGTQNLDVAHASFRNAFAELMRSLDKFAATLPPEAHGESPDKG